MENMLLPYPEGSLYLYNDNLVIKGKADIFNRITSALSSIKNQFTYVKGYPSPDYVEHFDPYKGYKPTVKRGVQNYQITTMRAFAVSLHTVVLYVDVISLPKKEDLLYHKTGATLAIFLKKRRNT